MIVKLLTEHNLEFLSLTGGCRGSSESTLVKMLEIACTGSYIGTFCRRNAEPQCFRTNFPYVSSGQQNAALSNIEQRLTYIRSLILKLRRSFPIEGRQ